LRSLFHLLFRWQVHRQVALPSSETLNFEVNPYGQPVVLRSFGQQLKAVYAGDALKWGILLVKQAIRVRDASLPDDIELQKQREPGR
jgi:hypothetical protein